MKLLRRVKRYCRASNESVDGKAVILMYHRVENLAGYAYPIMVSPPHFRQHMEYLRQAFRPTSLLDLVNEIEDGAVKNRTVVVTFDDGYADNFLNALPVIKEFQIPTTIFISSGYIGSSREFWWDDLERIFLKSNGIFGELEISIQNQVSKMKIDGVEKRRIVCRSVYHVLKSLSPRERDRHLDNLARLVGLERNGRSENRAMTKKELQELAQVSIVEIGAQTVNHPQLSALSLDAQYDEIVGGRRELERMVGRAVKTFCYPFGQPEDFTEETVRIIQEAKFSAACTTQQRGVGVRTDRFRLPRFCVNDWDLATFKEHLSNFFRN